EPAAPPPPGHLAIAVETVSARIEVDGKVVAQNSRAAQLSFPEAGEHMVVITAAGRRPWRRTVRVDRGMRVELPVSLDKLPPPPHDRNYVVDPFSGNQKR